MANQTVPVGSGGMQEEWRDIRGGTVFARTISMPAYTLPVVGTIIFGTAATQFPNVPCHGFRLVNHAANSIVFYMGTASNLTTANGFQVGAGVDLGWIPADNLNRFYHICSAVGGTASYMAFGTI